jgi:AcrR family transcriptional regulator
MNFDSSAANPRRLSYRQREKDARRQRILRAAEAAFSSCGYHDASVTEIAQNAGFAAGTIYLYFEDKADLYGSLIVEKMRLAVSRLEEALTGDGSACKCLRAAAHSQFAFHDANRKFFEIFLHQHQVQSSPLHERQWHEMEDLKRRNLALIEGCVTRGQAGGEIKDGNPRLYAVAFLGVTLQMIRQWIREKGAGRLADSADFAADCFLNGAASLPSREMKHPGNP